jgi:hypothetical protein
LALPPPSLLPMGSREISQAHSAIIGLRQASVPGSIGCSCNLARPPCCLLLVSHGNLACLLHFLEGFSLAGIRCLTCLSNRTLSNPNTVRIVILAPLLWLFASRGLATLPGPHHTLFPLAATALPRPSPLPLLLPLPLSYAPPHPLRTRPERAAIADAARYARYAIPSRYHTRPVSVPYACTPASFYSCAQRSNGLDHPSTPAFSFRRIHISYQPPLPSSLVSLVPCWTLNHVEI